MPFLEWQFFTQMTVKRREGKVGKPLLTSSALGGDKFRDFCDMETIPPEIVVLINNVHFPSFTSPKFSFRRSSIANEEDNTQLWLGESRAAPEQTPTIKSTISNWHGLAGSNYWTIQGQLEHLAYWALNWCFTSHIALRGHKSEASRVRCTVTCCTWLMSTILFKEHLTMVFYVWFRKKILQ